MKTATPGQVIQTLVILNQQDLGHEHYAALHSGYLAALAQAVKRDKLPGLAAFRKAIGLGILSIVTPHIHLSGEVAFRVSDRFVVNTDADVPISYLNDNWTEWFGGMEVLATESCDLKVNELTESSLDDPIMSEIGDDVCEVSPAILWLMMKHGHLSKDKWYIFYMKDKAGVCRAVSVCWHDDGWYVDARATSNPFEWRAGDLVVSRKRLVA